MADRKVTRLTAPEIYDNVLENGRNQLERSSSALAFAGVAAGLTMGLSALAVASVHALIGPDPTGRLVGALLYPTGFIAVIVGRAHLFTENTLYPVVLVLDERRYLAQMLRL